MTVTLTYKNAYYNDMDNATEWGAEVLSNMAAGDASISSDGDVLDFSGVTDNVAQQEYFYHQLDVSSTAISTSTYGYVSIRFRTEDASGSMQAYAVITYTAGSGGGSTIIDLGYSTTWKVTRTTLTAARTVEYIRLYCYEEAAANANGTTHVYYDWILFHAGTFTFPHVAPGGVQVNYPNKIVQIPIPGRYGDIIQHLGQGTPTITVQGDVLLGDTWETSTSDPHFDYLLRALNTDVWGYFSCDNPRIRCQVIIQNFTYAFVPEGNSLKITWQLNLALFKLSSLDSGQWGDWEWMYGA